MIGILAETINREFYLRSFHEQFSTPDPHLWSEVLLGITLVGGVVAVAWAALRWQRWRAQQGEMAPLALYRHVVTSLDLPPGDLWRLWRLAKVVRMPHPTAVLISAELFDEAVKRYCAGQSWLGSRKHTEPQFAAIRSRLFGT